MFYGNRKWVGSWAWAALLAFSAPESALNVLVARAKRVVVGLTMKTKTSDYNRRCRNWSQGTGFLIAVVVRVGVYAQNKLWGRLVPRGRVPEHVDAVQEWASWHVVGSVKIFTGIVPSRKLRESTNTNGRDIRRDQTLTTVMSKFILLA